MKKGIIVFMIIVLACVVLCGCEGTKDSDKINVVVTIYPEYNWVNELIKGVEDKYEITWLNDKGIDYHSYSPSIQDMAKVSSSDLFIYIGGESDGWVEDALNSKIKSEDKTINLMKELGENIYEEEVLEYMEEEEEEESDEIEYDEHIWLSLKNAIKCCNSITKKLISLDEENAAIYNANLESYTQKLQALDTQYAEAVSQAKKSCVIVGDRFPFLYMFKDYNISYYAAFVGCSTESTASVKTITALIEATINNNIEYIAAIDTYEKNGSNVANTIISECAKNKSYTIKDVIILDSLQTVSANDVKNGTTYLGTMEENLKQLKVLLG